MSAIGHVQFSQTSKTAEEEFVNGVYAAMDQAVASGMDQLRREEGVVSSCAKGCCHCCHFPVITDCAEAHTLAQYVRREMSPEQIDGLEQRTRQWHQWESSRPSRTPAPESFNAPDPATYRHSCPLLVNNVCTAYPVRPVACRTHLVSSDPLACHAAIDPKSTEDAPVAIRRAVNAARPFSRAKRKHIENAGHDYSRSLMLLPHSLAIEMGWDFALAP